MGIVLSAIGHFYGLPPRNFGRRVRKSGADPDRITFPIRVPRGLAPKGSPSGKGRLAGLS